MTNSADHLTTGKSPRIEELLREVAFDRVLLIVVSVKPRYQRTGLLEEQNFWIHALWKKVTGKFSEFVGCRVLWDTLFFVFDADEYQEVEVTFEKFLTELHDEKLKSFYISRVAEGNYERNLSDFDEMQHEAASDRNLGLLHDISVRIVDGSRK